MIEVETAAELDGHVGEILGAGEWLTVTQAMIDAFAEATGDHQWIHLDAARAARELPGGTTIAHGYLTLSLIPQLSRGVLRVRHRSRAINYGSNRVRFTSTVPSGSRVRLHQTLNACEAVEGGRRLTMECSLEVEGQTRPAMVAETISLIFD